MPATDQTPECMTLPVHASARRAAGARGGCCVTRYRYLPTSLLASSAHAPAGVRSLRDLPLTWVVPTQFLLVLLYVIGSYSVAVTVRCYHLSTRADHAITAHSHNSISRCRRAGSFSQQLSSPSAQGAGSGTALGSTRPCSSRIFT